MDESGLQTTDTYRYGWALEGERCEGLISGGRGQRYNVISALRASDRDWVAPWIFKGSCTRAVMEAWLHAFGKALPPREPTEPPYVLVMDNASFHKGGQIADIAQQYHIRIVYLPPYSPDLNPIEKAWATLKHYTRLLMAKGVEAVEALTQVFQKDVTSLRT